MLETVVLDSTLGRNTKFVFDFTSGQIIPTVTSPSGVIYNTTSDVVMFDQSLKTYSFNIPDGEFEVGTWTYSIESPASSDPQSVSVTVTSLVSASRTATYATNCYWVTSNVPSLSPQLSSVPQIAATVSLGKHLP